MPSHISWGVHNGYTGPGIMRLPNGTRLGIAPMHDSFARALPPHPDRGHCIAPGPPTQKSSRLFGVNGFMQDRISFFRHCHVRSAAKTTLIAFLAMTMLFGVT
jgi:hypothetical protein